MEKISYTPGTGRRKTAVAQVKLMPGSGVITVNGSPYEERFNRFQHRRQIEFPILVTENTGKLNIVVKVTGGGVSGQSAAIAHGIARALLASNGSYKPVLRQHGLLTRDDRAKERKKVGLKRARKAPQYTKR